MLRNSEVSRITGETDISLSLNLDGSGIAKIETECGFLEHMLTLFAKHAGFDLEVYCKGDHHIDDHHAVEDIGIALGMAFLEAMGDLRGVNRYGHIILPMDEALILAAVDLSGRAHLSCDLDIPSPKVGDFDTELVEEFLMAFTRNANLTLHVKQLAGKNSHHIIEGCFKALARALKMAVECQPGNSDIPSTKGVLV